MSDNLLEYNLPTNAYATFDAVTLKELIKNRLTQTSLFTDQNYEGSNLAALADIFAFAYHILLFYYNQTAAESLFDQAELYENMNKIVRSIGYKPSGPRTSALSFDARATADLSIGSYTIKRYSYIIINGIVFSFPDDISFDKTESGEEVLATLSDNTLLYQGSYSQYPDYTAIGEDYETVILANESNDAGTEFIDYDHIDVYVYNLKSDTWKQWREVDTLYLQRSSDEVYEKRTNEAGRYEIKFGNNINGKKLNAGDIVSIFYLLSNGSVIGANTIQSGSNINVYNNARFRDLGSVLYSENNSSFISANNSSFIQLTNSNGSTAVSDYENVDSIKQNAPALFSAQSRAVTINDYKAFINSKFNNVIQSAEVMNNSSYLSEYMKYYLDINETSPNENIGILTSRVIFADACDFNNVYIIAVPKIGPIQSETTPIPIPASQKQYIKAGLDEVRMVNSEIVVVDPVYIAFDLGVEIADDSRSLELIRESTTLSIKVDSTSRIARSKVRNSVYNIINNYFLPKNNVLGQQINFSNIVRDILSVETVVDVNTVLTINNQIYTTPGISMVYWNPLYDQADVNITNQNIKLPIFKFPFLYEASKLINKIVIEE